MIKDDFDENEVIGRMKVVYSGNYGYLYCKGYISMDGVTKYITIRPNGNAETKADADLLIYENLSMRSRILSPKERMVQDGQISKK